MSSQLILDGILPIESRFDPLHVTFSGGARDPFNRWYPYLEGYSPEFVRTILEIFAPSAKAILDPFGGTGTTAFVASEKGVPASVCEVNPVMQFIFDNPGCRQRDIAAGLSYALNTIRESTPKIKHFGFTHKRGRGYHPPALR